MRNDFVDMSAVAAAMLADSTPQPVGLDSVPGTGGQASRADHTHTARTQRAPVTLDANGEQTWTYARPYDNKPVLGFMYEEIADNQPVTVKVKAHIKTGAQWTGVTVKGYRAQTLPSALTLLTQLLNFNAASGGAAPSGLVVNLSAGDPTQ